jgi:hypothetical protein
MVTYVKNGVLRGVSENDGQIVDGQDVEEGSNNRSASEHVSN